MALATSKTIATFHSWLPFEQFLFILSDSALNSTIVNFFLSVRAVLQHTSTFFHDLFVGQRFLPIIIDGSYSEETFPIYFSEPLCKTSTFIKKSLACFSMRKIILRYCPMEGGVWPPPWYLSCGTLKIPKLNFPKQIWS